MQLHKLSDETIHLWKKIRNNNLLQNQQCNWFVDKYSPKNMIDYDNILTDNIYFHKDIINRLRLIAKDDSLPHIIFYGNSGIGKKTIINLFLELIYDDSIYNMTDSKYTVKSGNNVETDVIIKQSDHHIIIEPNNNNFDRYLLQDVVKEYAKRKSLNIYSAERDFKSVQINNLDNMSYYAQTSLRRTMEKYSKNCRFVMWCYSLSKVIEPLQSRCLCINIPDIPEDELFKWIFSIACQENIKINIKTILNILHESNSDLKDILWRLELFKKNGTIKNSYHLLIDELINNIVTKPTIPFIRDILYKILTKNIKASQIVKDILKYFLTNNKYEKYYVEIVNNASEYEYRLAKGRRDIIHLEAFIISIINLINK